MIDYKLASDSWGTEEINAIGNVIDSNNYTMGERVSKFEKEFAKYVGSKYAVMVNSGSSANLLMMSILRYKYGFNSNVNIIVPAVGWSTTYYPIHQNNFTLNFVDIDRYTLNIDSTKIERAIDKNTKAILAVNLLGNPCDFNHLRTIAYNYNLLLLEDNCESFGAKYENRFTGTFGIMGTYSFFFSHHLQTMEGGMIVTNDERIMQYLKSMRAHGWCRDLPMNDELYQKTGDWFKDHFTFILPGYSIRPLEIEGAIGSEQLKKASKFINKRRENATDFKKLFSNQDWCDIQEEVGESSWYGFSIVFKGKLEGKRDLIAQKLIKNGIEIRPIMSGNFMKNPCMKYLKYLSDDRIGVNYNNVNYIDKNGLFLGNHVYRIGNKLNYVYKLIVEELV